MQKFKSKIFAYGAHRHHKKIRKKKEINFNLFFLLFSTFLWHPPPAPAPSFSLATCYGNKSNAPNGEAAECAKLLPHLFALVFPSRNALRISCNLNDADDIGAAC